MHTKQPMRLFLLPILLLAGCVARSPEPGAGATPGTRAPGEDVVQVVLYRGLRLQAGSPNAIDWTKNSFGVSGMPPTLSLFDNTGGIAGIPCWLVITVDVPAPVAPGSIGQLTTVNPPPGGANPGPWGVTFDNVPAGHWSIARATIGGASNNASSAMAAAVFDAMTVAGMTQIQDGTAVGCH